LDPGFPRLRGDGPAVEHRGGAARGFPPPTRGWTRYQAASMRHRAVSPAYAGMDLSRGVPGLAMRPRLRFPPPTRGWTDRSRDAAGPSAAATGGSSFPRLRGDGPVTIYSRPGAGQFPPPTRGWTRASY